MRLYTVNTTGHCTMWFTHSYHNVVLIDPDTGYKRQVLGLHKRHQVIPEAKTAMHKMGYDSPEYTLCFIYLTSQKYKEWWCILILVVVTNECV